MFAALRSDLTSEIDSHLRINSMCEIMVRRTITYSRYTDKQFMHVNQLIIHPTRFLELVGVNSHIEIGRGKTIVRFSGRRR